MVLGLGVFAWYWLVDLRLFWAVISGFVWLLGRLVFTAFGCWWVGAFELVDYVLFYCLGV